MDRQQENVDLDDMIRRKRDKKGNGHHQGTDEHQDEQDGHLAGDIDLNDDEDGVLAADGFGMGVHSDDEEPGNDGAASKEDDGSVGMPEPDLIEEDEEVEEERKREEEEEEEERKTRKTRKTNRARRGGTRETEGFFAPEQKQKDAKNSASLSRQCVYSRPPYSGESQQPALRRQPRSKQKQYHLPSRAKMLWARQLRARARRPLPSPYPRAAVLPSPEYQSCTSSDLNTDSRAGDAVVHCRREARAPGVLHHYRAHCRWNLF